MAVTIADLLAAIHVEDTAGESNGGDADTQRGDGLG